MTSNGEKLMIGLLAFIAYELYRGSAAPTVGQLRNRPSLASNADQAPPWVQQLSQVEQQEIYSEYVNNNYQISEDITDNLLSIPQGPGGGTYIPPLNTDTTYFTPNPSLFCG